MHSNQFERVYLAAFAAIFDTTRYEEKPPTTLKGHEIRDWYSAKRQAVCSKARHLAEEMVYNIRVMEEKDR